VPRGFDCQVEIRGQPRPMCCHGCEAVARAIVAGGLGGFYDHRTAPAPTPEELIPAALRRMDVYDQARLQQSFVQFEQGSVRQASLILEGITCAACVWLNEHYLSRLPGVLELQVNYSTHRARVRWDDGRIHLSDILKAVASIGYVAHPFDPSRQEALQQKERSRALRRLAVAGLGAMQVMMVAVALYAGDYSGMALDMRAFMRWVSLVITLPVVVYSGGIFFRSAWRDLRHRRLGMDVPVSLAIGAALLASIWHTVANAGPVYYDSVSMFTFFLLGSRFLEMGARHRAGQAAEELVRLLPATATRLSAGGDEAVAVADLVPGDRVRVRPGETVPADGIVEEGTSSVDESLLTGESLPRARGAGDSLVGGTLNVESPLVMRIEKVGEDTVVSAIVRLLDRAQAEKPRVALLADRVAVWLVAGLLVLAAVVALYWWQHDPGRAFAITLSVLVVTCPCALSLATPAAVTAATGALTRAGLLTTRGHALETLARATHLVLDKTGTLTRGQLQLSETRALRGLDPCRALAIASALERSSEHPVAQVLASADSGALSATGVSARPGQGVEGRVNDRLYRVGSPRFVAALSGEPPAAAAPGLAATRVALGDERGVIAWFLLSDELRSDAATTLACLQRLGLHTELLSGDASGPVRAAAERLGVAEYRWGMSPQDKLDRIRALQAEGAVVAMVGDGVNDAPVLAAAQVSLAMGSGTSLAHASADMVLLSERLGHLATGVIQARRTVRIIRQNLAWALLYNALAVPLAAAGWVAPWMAAIGMSLSSLVVVGNALRLKRIRQPGCT